jgi:hypothetical protein
MIASFQKVIAGKKSGSRLFVEIRANRDFRGKRAGFGREV